MRYYSEKGALYAWVCGAPVRVPDWADHVLVDSNGLAYAANGVEPDEVPKLEEIGKFSGWQGGRQLIKLNDCLTDSCPVMLTARAVQSWN